MKYDNKLWLTKSKKHPNRYATKGDLQRRLKKHILKGNNDYNW